MHGIDRDTFRRVFEKHWDEFKSCHASYATQYYEDVVRKMLGCGREEGGYCEYLCTKCGMDRRRIAFTCKSCFCLSCAKGYTDDFVAQVSQILRPGLRYRHMVLTVPEQLRIHFYRNRQDGMFLSELMRRGYECLEDVVSTAVRK